MGRLRKVNDGTEIPMPARLLVGRAHTSGLRLATAVASGDHASIVWTGGHWEVRDLGSTNGTLVDKVRIEPGKPLRIRKGTKLMFGGPSETWELSSDDGPDAMATEVGTGEVRVAQANLLALPTLEAPQLSIYQRGGEWVTEDDDGEVRPVVDQELLVIGDRSWKLHLPMHAEGTPMVEPGPTLATVSFVFRVSMSQEVIDIAMTHKGQTMVLESRGHGYVLLTLAQQRKADAELSVGERGWLDRDVLLDMVKMDKNSLNVAIHRARHQLLDAGIEGAYGIVEVRRNQRRLGTDRFEITSF